MTRQKQRRKAKEVENQEQEDVQQEISTLKKKKAIIKTTFTRTKHNLIQQLAEDEIPEKDEIRGIRSKFKKTNDELITVMLELANKYEAIGDYEKENKVTDEIEEMNKECEQTMEQVNGFIASDRGDESSAGFSSYQDE